METGYNGWLADFRQHYYPEVLQVAIGFIVENRNLRVKCSFNNSTDELFPFLIRQQVYDSIIIALK